jgi:hypothetical protein
MLRNKSVLGSGVELPHNYWNQIRYFHLLHSGQTSFRSFQHCAQATAPQRTHCRISLPDALHTLHPPQPALTLAIRIHFLPVNY